jgi:hypothetical protein
MKIHDLSKLNYSTVDSQGKPHLERIPFSTDQYLFEIAQIKDSINRQILTAVKETAIDCLLSIIRTQMNHLFAMVSVKLQQIILVPILY